LWLREPSLGEIQNTGRLFVVENPSIFPFISILYSVAARKQYKYEVLDLIHKAKYVHHCFVSWMLSIA
jgi:hypothetical protein